MLDTGDPTNLQRTQRRTDLSDHLIHFTKGIGPEEAFATLRQIIHEGRLLGGTGMIRGSYQCVCFTEAPLDSLRPAFRTRLSTACYAPFGVMFSKDWTYANGGRPVIYQADEEFWDLPEAIRWRHVRFELGGDPSIDFSWEREWRVCTPELRFRPAEATVIVPDEWWSRRLQDEHDENQRWQIELYSTAIDRELAEQLFSDPFLWRVVSLDA